MDEQQPDPTSRLALLEELVKSLRPVILADHSDTGLQGMSGLVGQYRAALAEIEEIKAKAPKVEGTALDEVTARRAEKAAKGSPRSARRRV